MEWFYILNKETPLNSVIRQWKYQNLLALSVLLILSKYYHILWVHVWNRMEWNRIKHCIFYFKISDTLKLENLTLCTIYCWAGPKDEQVEVISRTYSNGKYVLVLYFLTKLQPVLKFHLPDLITNYNNMFFFTDIITTKAWWPKFMESVMLTSLTSMEYTKLFKWMRSLPQINLAYSTGRFRCSLFCLF